MIPLNADQKEAIRLLHEFVAGPNSFFLLKGQAGTGKTTCINTFVEETNLEVALTAPTNKATGVLRAMAEEKGVTAECRTIYSILGLRIVKDSEFAQVEAIGECDAMAYSVVVVDEGYMLQRSVFGYAQEAALEGVKFIVMGDPYQLPPVGEKESMVSTISLGYTLTKVERHDNQILDLSNSLRKAQDEGTKPKFKTDHGDDGEGVYCVNSKKFVKLLGNAFTSDTHKDHPEHFKCITWTNNAARFYNERIREFLYGEEANSRKFFEGESVIAAHPILDFRSSDDDFVMSTDEEAVVQSVEVVEHPMFKQLMCYHLVMDTRLGTEEAVHGYVIHESSEKAYKKLLGVMADEARSKRGSWSSFWALKDQMFMDIRPSHAITTHRSQGSTYPVTFADSVDFLSNRRSLEAKQCVYTACTRASQKLIILTR